MTKIKCSQCGCNKGCKCDGKSSTVDAAPADLWVHPWWDYVKKYPGSLESRVYDV